MSGYGSGKTHALCAFGYMISKKVPNNLGFLGRATGKDLQSTTLKSFAEDVCPPEDIVGRPKRIGQTGFLYTIRCDPPYQNCTSQIYFDYIIDKQTGRSHLAGGNWGWFGVDQLEEIGRADWAKLKGRLRRTVYDPRQGKKVAIRTHALGVGNANGHDWIFEDFYSSGDYIFDVLREPRRFFKEVHTPLSKLTKEEEQRFRLGIVSRSEENSVSNGGFAPDDYFESFRRSNPPQVVARFLDCSFDDFTGKIYGDYNLNSVHNIEPFEIPEHWPWLCSIDPGGSVPWGVGVWRVDEDRNLILVDSAEQLYVPRVNPIHAANWLRKHTPVEKTRYLIDYQNGPVTALLADSPYFIYCESALKDQKIGFQGTMGAFFVNPARHLPGWYEATQPRERFLKFSNLGSPKIFAFNTCKSWMKSHDNYIWDPVKKNEPKGGQEDHHPDQTRYALAANPAAAERPVIDPYAAYRKGDPVSAQHNDRIAKEIAALKKKGSEVDFGDDPFGGRGSGEGNYEMIGDFI